MNDEDLKRHMWPYSIEPGPENPGIPRKTSISDFSDIETLTPLARILLENIALQPHLGIAQRLKKLGLSTTEGYKLTQELERKKLIKPLTIDGKRLYETTAAARRTGFVSISRAGRGGLEHHYWIQQIKALYEKQCQVKLEKDDLDVVVDKEGQILAIQLETGKSDLEGKPMEDCPL